MVLCPVCGFVFLDEDILELDGFTIDRRGCLSYRGQEIRVRPWGLKIVWQLASSNGQTVSLAELMGDTATTQENVEVQISYLRTALKRAKAPDVLRTVRTRGFTWHSPHTSFDIANLDVSGGEPGDLSDMQWRALAPIVTKRRGSGGQILLNNRSYLDGILYLLRTGAAWKQLPPRYGKWNSIFKRCARWADQGVWDDLLPALVGLGLTHDWQSGAPNPGSTQPAQPRHDHSLRHSLVERAEALRGALNHE